MTRALNLGAQRATLGNGVRLVVLPMAGRKQGMLSLDFRTGSRFERPDENGISHFLEHMLFRGTPRHPTSHALAAAFEDLGGTLEASTAADRGNLSICLPGANLVRASELVAEVFSEPLLTDVEVERSIIYEEIQEDFDDRGNLVDGASALRKLAFGDHGLGQLITGPAENLERFDTSALRAHHAKTHTAGSLVLCVAGDFQARRMLDVLQEQFDRVPPGPELELSAPEEQHIPRFSFVSHSGSSQTAIHLGFRGPGQSSVLDPALEMLLRVIDDGMSTRLYQRLVDQSGLCYDVSASMEAYADVGLIEFEATTSHQTCRKVVNELLLLTAELRETRVGAAELDRARRRVQWEYEAVGDSVTDVAEVFGYSEFSGTSEPEVRLQRLLAVSAEEIRAAAAQVLVPSRRNLVTIGQLGAAERQRLEDAVLGEG